MNRGARRPQSLKHCSDASNQRKGRPIGCRPPAKAHAADIVLRYFGSVLYLIWG